MHIPHGSVAAFTVRSQRLVTMTALVIYAIILGIFLMRMDTLPADQRLTIAVLLLTPLAGLVGGVNSFWLSRSRNQESDKPSPMNTPPAITDSSSTVTSHTDTTGDPP